MTVVGRLAIAMPVAMGTMEGNSMSWLEYTSQSPWTWLAAVKQKSKHELKRQTFYFHDVIIEGWGYIKLKVESGLIR